MSNRYRLRDLDTFTCSSLSNVDCSSPNTKPCPVVASSSCLLAKTMTTLLLTLKNHATTSRGFKPGSSDMSVAVPYSILAALMRNPTAISEASPVVGIRRHRPLLAQNTSQTEIVVHAYSQWLRTAVCPAVGCHTSAITLFKSCAWTLQSHAPCAATAARRIFWQQQGPPLPPNSVWPVQHSLWLLQQQPSAGAGGPAQGAYAASDWPKMTDQHWQISRIQVKAFKSFGPAGCTFDVPSHLVGIVGPNGCGKSNLLEVGNKLCSTSACCQCPGLQYVHGTLP